MRLSMSIIASVLFWPGLQGFQSPPTIEELIEAFVTFFDTHIGAQNVEAEPQP